MERESLIDFVTSDTHFGHASLVKWNDRPFKTVEEMDAALIDNWNATVKDKNKHVWHLGDFAFRNIKAVEWYRNQLYGHVHMVFGNHDDKGAKKYHGWASAHEAKYLRKDGHKLTLYHFSQRTWRNAAHGGWHLFGHSHGRLPPYGLSFDVGVDAHGFKPWSWNEIVERMSTLNPEVCDRNFKGD